MNNISAKINPDGSIDLTGKQGTTWVLTLTLTESNGNPVDLTDYEITAQVKRSAGATAVVATFDGSVGDDPTQGVATLTMLPAITSTIIAPKSYYVYDVKLTKGTDMAYRLTQGKLFVDPQVTT